MRINGQCHCGNVAYVLEWPHEGLEIPARACECTFCTKHGGVWTSHPSAALRVGIQAPAFVSLYAFGTRTATFHVCARCGAVPLVTSDIAGHRYAVVNVNTFDNADVLQINRTAANFDTEPTAARLERRTRNWIRDVCFD